MSRVTAVRWIGAVTATVTLACAFAATTATRRFSERRYAEWTASSAAAYLSAVTRGSDPGEFLTRVRALASLPDWAPDLEVYLGTAPLVRATDPSLPLSALAALSGRSAPRWDEGAAYAPVPGPEPGRITGVVRVRPPVSDDPFHPWLLALLGVTAVAGVLASVRLQRRYWGWWLGVYAVTALAFGGVAGSAANTGLRTATNRWLRETGVLLEDAGSRVPRTAPATLATVLRGLAADGRLVVDGSADPVSERIAALARPGTPLPVWLGAGRWLSLEPPADDWSVAVGDAVAGTAALAGVLVLLALSWAARDRVRPGQTEETITAWTFLAPAGVHLTALTIAPLGLLVYVAVHRWDLGAGPGPFVGLGNLVDVASRADTWTAFGRTALFALHVPVAAVIALGLALAARGLSGSFTRALLVLPPLGSIAAVAFAWRHGLASSGWLDRPSTALWTLAAIAAVLQVGFQVPAFLAGLDRIPAVLWESAALDGAGPWARFRRVTEPLLRPVTLSVLITGLVLAVQAFTLTFIAGNGSPGTELAALHLYRLGWVEGHLDLAAALALLLVALLAVAVAFQVWIWGRVASAEPDDA